MSTETHEFTTDFSTLHVPTQKSAPEAPTEDMQVLLQSYPPLGQVTPVKDLSDGAVVFTTVLKVPRSRATESWNVVLWLSADGKEWCEVGLNPLDTKDAVPKALQVESESTVMFYFTGIVKFRTSVRFTLKFRHEGDELWRWIRDEQGLDDGHIVVNTIAQTADELSKLIPALNNTWKVSSRMSQTPKTQLWSLECMIGAAESNKSLCTDIEIGTPWGSFMRWFAIVRLWSPWLAPRHGKTDLSLNEDAILCSFLDSNGKHLVFLAVGGINNVVPVFRSTPDGALTVHIRNDGSSEEKAMILVSLGDDFDRAVASVMYHARSLAWQTQEVETQKSDQGMKDLSESIGPEQLENWHDGLGFCTWNALGQRLTEEKLLDALDKLEKHNISITNLIIDDNWQSIDQKGSSYLQRGWVDFEADSIGFPNGLKAAVAKIREKYPALHHIAVWHALLGYWGGISPDGKLAKTYKTIEVVREEAKSGNLPLGGTIRVIAKEDVSKFYEDFYSFLRDAGVDGVKTDAQFMLDMCESASIRRELINTYLDAWTLLSLRYFGVKTISCMSQIPQALFRTQMLQNRPVLVVRNSDDFFPQAAASHPWHVWTNAHNSIFTQYLNVLPDWDMFQTAHDYSGFHAAARCVSGGPLYITDVPGEHNVDLIRQMTGTTPSGKTIIFRPSVLGKSVFPYMGYEDDLLLKVGGYNGASETGTSILALFNISKRPLTELIPLSCFPGTLTSFEYVVRAHTTGKTAGPLTLSSSASLVTSSLDVRGYEILCAFPLSRVGGQKHNQILVSNLGLVGKMTGCAAMVKNNVEKRTNGVVSAYTKLRALGVLGVYISGLPNMTIEGDLMVTLQDQAVPVHTVSISKGDSRVLEVDIETAWKELGLKSEKGDQVEVRVLFNV